MGEEVASGHVVRRENGLVCTVCTCVKTLVNLRTTKNTSIHQRQ